MPESASAPVGVSRLSRQMAQRVHESVCPFCHSRWVFDSGRDVLLDIGESSLCNGCRAAVQDQEVSQRCAED